MITPDTIEKIMDAVRIEEVVGEFVSLKRRGVNLVGLCPFHNEKTPSFSVSAPKGIFKCFGCGKGGNAVNFLMEHEHYTYPEALRYLAQKYNIEIEEERPSPEQQQAMDLKESLFNVSAFAQKYFEERLHESEEGRSIALTYLKERGFTTEVIRRFGLGYCPGAWDDFTQTALKNGYKKEYLQMASLSKSKDQMLYDTFRDRIIFPIHNLSGRVLGFGGRILTNEKNRPKYINSAESEIYQKSKVLYGIYFAKSQMVALDNCYLVEGYTDVIALHQAGITNVIATSGTALTTDQIKLIRRYTSNVTLLFDGDPAGIKAAFRGLDLILEEGLNVRVVLFPDGEDPDSFAREKRPAEVRSFVEEQAADFVSFKTSLLLEETKDDPIRKAQLIKEIAKTIALIPEPIARSIYVQKCSTMMGVEEQLMVSEVNRIRREKLKNKHRQETPGGEDMGPEPDDRRAAPQKQEPEEANHRPEQEIIRLLLNHGGKEIIFEVENEDKRMEEVAVTVAEFILQDIRSDGLLPDNPACQAIFNEYAVCWEQKKLPTHSIFTEHQNDEVRKLAIDLLTSQHTLSKNWEHRHKIYVKEEEEELKVRVLYAVYAFKLQKLEKMLAEIQQKIRDASLQTSENDEMLLELMKDQRDLLAKRGAFAHELDRVVTR